MNEFDEITRKIRFNQHRLQKINVISRMLYSELKKFKIGENNREVYENKWLRSLKIKHKLYDKLTQLFQLID